MTNVSTEKQVPSMAERGRRGGLATAAAKRRRRDRDVGIVAWDVLNADPEPVIKRVYESGNAVAIVDMIRFATEAKTAQLKAQEIALEQRDRELRGREGQAERVAEWVEMLRRQREKLDEEVRALKAIRSELRAAIEREAEEHDMELVEVDDAAVAEA